MRFEGNMGRTPFDRFIAEVACPVTDHDGNGQIDAECVQDPIPYGQPSSVLL
jgi:hypothetical protein